MDLLLFHRGQRLGFEFKCADAPRMTKSMHIALQDLDLHQLYVVYPGEQSYPLHENVLVIPLTQIMSRVAN